MMSGENGRFSLLYEISVVIPNYNGLKYIGRCIDSLFLQSYKNFELIIVDNASQDGSCEYIKENYPEVKLITLNKNYGFSRAVNEGIKTSKSKYIVLLNNDTEVEEKWLENLFKCIDKDENVFSCCSKMLRYYEKDIIDDAGDEYCILGWAYKRGDGTSSKKYSKNQVVFSSCAGAAIYRKKVFDKIGYFDESFFAYMEDVDISYRANIYGYKNIYCSDAIVYHIGSATSGSKYNSFKVRLAARNNIYVVLKNMPLAQIIINFPFLFIGYLIKFIFFYQLGYKKEYLEGTKQAFENIKEILKIKYDNKNIIHYIKIEFNMIRNIFKYMFSKIFKF